MPPTLCCGWGAPRLAAGSRAVDRFVRLVADFASRGRGRVYAAYGGVYITASVFCMWLVEELVPDRWDIAGAILSLGGAGVIISAPRS